MDDDDRNDGLKFGDGVNFNDPDDPYSSDLGFLEADEYPDDIIPSNKKRKIELQKNPFGIDKADLAVDIGDNLEDLAAVWDSKEANVFSSPEDQKKYRKIQNRLFPEIKQQKKTEQELEEERLEFQRIGKDLKRKRVREREGGKRKTSKRKTGKRKTSKRKTSKRKTSKRR